MVKILLAVKIEVNGLVLAAILTETVSLALKIRNPDGISERKAHRLKRRVYIFQLLNFKAFVSYFFIFSPNDSPSKTTKSAFDFI